MEYYFRFLKNEIYRILHGKVFLVLLGILLIFVALDGVCAWSVYRKNLEQTLEQIPLSEDGTFSEYPWLQIYTLYNSWLGGRVNQLIPQMFLYALPVFSVIPYAVSYLSEEKSGYTRTMVSKVGKSAYFIGKYISVFLSGFFISVFPLLFSLMITACLVPAYKPDVNFGLYYQIISYNLLNNLYFTKPMLTVFIVILRIGIFSGAWATITYVLTFFVKNQFISMFCPYLVLLFIIASLDRALVYRSYLETSILDYIWLTSPTSLQNLWVFLGEMLALLLIPFFIVLAKGRTTDVF